MNTRMKIEFWSHFLATPPWIAPVVAALLLAAGLLLSPGHPKAFAAQAQ